MLNQNTTSVKLHFKAVKMRKYKGGRPSLKPFITSTLWTAYQKLNGRTIYGRTQSTRAMTIENRAVKIGLVTKRGYVGVKLCNT